MKARRSLALPCFALPGLALPCALICLDAFGQGVVGVRMEAGSGPTVAWVSAGPDRGVSTARWLIEWSGDLRAWHGVTFEGSEPAGEWERWRWPVEAGAVGFARVTAAELSVRWGRSPKSALSSPADVLGLTNVTHSLLPSGAYAFAAGDGYDFWAWPEVSGVPRAGNGFYLAPFQVAMADASDGYAGTVVNGWTYQSVTIGSDVYRVFRTQNVLHGAVTITVNAIGAP
jgi:hypothetical protein